MVSDIARDDSAAFVAAETAFDRVLLSASLPESLPGMDAQLLREALAAGVRAALAAYERNLPHLLGELPAAQRRVDVLSDALYEMVGQFGFHSDGGLRHSGGLPALEGAFAALGLSDPHPREDGEPCDEPGCARPATVGFPSNEEGYRRTCRDHAPPFAVESMDLMQPEPTAG